CTMYPGQHRRPLRTARRNKAGRGYCVAPLPWGAGRSVAGLPFPLTRDEDLCPSGFVDIGIARTVRPIGKGLARSVKKELRHDAMFYLLVPARHWRCAIVISPSQNAAFERAGRPRSRIRGHHDKVAAGRCNLCNIAPGAVGRLAPKEAKHEGPA